MLALSLQRCFFRGRLPVALIHNKVIFKLSVLVKKKLLHAELQRVQWDGMVSVAAE